LDGTNDTKCHNFIVMQSNLFWMGWKTSL
jgi:hypothetical protein